MYDDDKFGPIFPVGDGKVAGRGVVRKMFDALGGAGGFRTRIQDTPEGLVTLRTKNGMPQLTVTPLQKTIQEIIPKLFALYVPWFFSCYAAYTSPSLVGNSIVGLFRKKGASSFPERDLLRPFDSVDKVFEIFAFKVHDARGGMTSNDLLEKGILSLSANIYWDFNGASGSYFRWHKLGVSPKWGDGGTGEGFISLWVAPPVGVYGDRYPRFGRLDSTARFIVVPVQKRGGKVWVGPWYHGLLRVEDGVLKIGDYSFQILSTDRYVKPYERVSNPSLYVVNHSGRPPVPSEGQRNYILTPSRDYEFTYDPVGRCKVGGELMGAADFKTLYICDDGARCMLYLEIISTKVGTTENWGHIYELGVVVRALRPFPYGLDDVADFGSEVARFTYTCEKIYTVPEVIPDFSPSGRKALLLFVPSNATFFNGTDKEYLCIEVEFSGGSKSVLPTASVREIEDVGFILEMEMEMEPPDKSAPPSGYDYLWNYIKPPRRYMVGVAMWRVSIPMLIGYGADEELSIVKRDTLSKYSATWSSGEGYATFDEHQFESTSLIRNGVAIEEYSNSYYWHGYAAGPSRYSTPVPPTPTAVNESSSGDPFFYKFGMFRYGIDLVESVRCLSNNADVADVRKYKFGEKTDSTHTTDSIAVITIDGEIYRPSQEEYVKSLYPPPDYSYSWAAYDPVEKRLSLTPYTTWV
jgi:hypothetical protein